MQVGDCWRYALEAINKVILFVISQLFIICFKYHAITVLRGNINTRVVYKQTRSLVASIQLVHWSSDDQGFLVMDNYVG